MKRDKEEKSYKVVSTIINNHDPNWDKLIFCMQTVAKIRNQVIYQHTKDLIKHREEIYQHYLAGTLEELSYLDQYMIKQIKSLHEYLEKKKKEVIEKGEEWHSSIPHYHKYCRKDMPESLSSMNEKGKLVLDLYKKLKEDSWEGYEGELHNFHFKKVSSAIVNQALQGYINGENNGYIASKIAYFKDKSKFLGMPKAPGFKPLYHLSVGIGNGLTVKDRHAFLSDSRQNPLNFVPISIPGMEKHGNKPRLIEDKDLMGLRFIPLGEYYKVDDTGKKHFYPEKIKIEFIYKDNGFNQIQKIQPNENIMGIDPGIKSVLTLTSNVYDFKFKLIPLTEMKSMDRSYQIINDNLKSIGKINQNKEFSNDKAFSSHRIRRNQIYIDNKKKHTLHVVSRYIVSLCVKYDISTIVIGCNKQQKQNVSLGKKTNRIFCSIPHRTLAGMLKDKCLPYGIRVIEQEESYTSKASFIDQDPIPTKSKDEEEDKKKKQTYVFSGRRNDKKALLQRKYTSKHGYEIHSDVNGSLNIIRKAFPNFIKNNEVLLYVLKGSVDNLEVVHYIDIINFLSKN